jgi:1-acyl-sn-glycerol-3-phosphate acyltransferase
LPAFPILTILTNETDERWIGVAVRKFLGKWFLRLNGWESEGGRPIPRQYVLIAAPHTSNWDLPYLLAFAAIYDVHISWMGKHSLFHGPMGWVMRALGGIPIVRSKRGNRVEELAGLFKQRPELVLVVPAEGTRRYTAHWKSGFYHIAKTAGVPIVMSFLDFGRKQGGFGPALHPSDDLTADMDEIRDFYADKQGKFSENFGPIRLKEEM